MIASRDEPHRVDERLPGLALTRQHAAPFRRQLIEAAPALPGLLHPLALKPAALLEAIQQRIERRQVELQLPARAAFDQLAELVAVTRTALNNRQDDQLRRPFLQFAIEHAGVYICHSHACYSQSIPITSFYHRGKEDAEADDRHAVESRRGAGSIRRGRPARPARARQQESRKTRDRKDP